MSFLDGSDSACGASSQSASWRMSSRYLSPSLVRSITCAPAALADTLTRLWANALRLATVPTTAA
jgi:hypothetical protein